MKIASYFTCEVNDIILLLYTWLAKKIVMIILKQKNNKKKIFQLKKNVIILKLRLFISFRDCMT